MALQGDRRHPEQHVDQEMRKYYDIVGIKEHTPNPVSCHPCNVTSLEYSKKMALQMHCSLVGRGLCCLIIFWQTNEAVEWTQFPEAQGEQGFAEMRGCWSSEA
jgi:hypothetical protein